MKKRTSIIALSTAGLMIIGLAVTTVVFANKSKALEVRLSSMYDQSLQELSVDITSLTTKLNKLEAASSSNQRALLLMDVWRQTGDMQGSISAMPVSYQNTSSLSQFVNRMGDYCYSLAKKVALDEDLTDEDISQIKALVASCGDIGKCLEEGETEFSLSGDAFLSDEDTNLDFTSQEYARLQYDGPFSESTQNKQPEGLGDKKVDEVVASITAAEFLGVDQSMLSDADIINSDIVCYAFTGMQDGNDFTIYITKQGGDVLWYMSSRAPGISAVPTDRKYEELTKIAQDYAKDKGYGDTKPSYAQFYNGMAIINLAPVENDVVLYPDLIKVWVDISKSEVAGIDANNYLFSHKHRELEEPELSMQQAREFVTSDMRIQSARLALIPQGNGAEALCYEFTGTVGENDYIIYINAQTGVEEDILMIQHTNDGTLVM